MIGFLSRVVTKEGFKMSYKELLMKLKQLNAEQLSQTVTVFDHTLQEFIPVDGSDFSADFADVLDFNHFYLQVTT